MAYKVVAVKGGILQSVCACPAYLYTKEKNVRPKDCGPFACFDTIEHTKDCIIKFEWHIGEVIKVFKCKIRRSRTKALYNTHNNFTSSFPDGTIFAASVILLNEIPLKDVIQ